MDACASVNVLLTKDHVILTKGSYSLWCCRGDGKLLPGKGRSLQLYYDFCSHIHGIMSARFI